MLDTKKIEITTIVEDEESIRRTSNKGEYDKRKAKINRRAKVNYYFSIQQYQVSN